MKERTIAAKARDRISWWHMQLIRFLAGKKAIILADKIEVRGPVTLRGKGGCCCGVHIDGGSVHDESANVSYGGSPELVRRP